MIKINEDDYTKVFQSNNYGPFKIIGEAKIPGYNKRAVVIKFLNTGTICTVKYAAAKYGRVKDRYLPIYHGVGCIGNASCYDPAYRLWSNMMSRCYNTTNKSYINYGAKGIKVCDRWLCFENFLNDLPKVDGYSNWVNMPGMYKLDKDFKQQNMPECQKVYSPETCCFLSNQDNIALSDQSTHFMGLEQLSSGKFRVRAIVNSNKYNIGLFNDPIIAANAYNNFITLYCPYRTILNNVPKMAPDEVMKYNLSPRQLYRLI